MIVRPVRRPARSAALLLGAASVLVVGTLVGAQAAAADGPVAAPSSTTSTSTPPPTPIMDRVGCEASLEILSEWPGGFVAQVRVVNVSTFSSLAGWRVTVELPEGEATHAWSSVLDTTTDDGVARFGAASWNSFVGYGGAVEFGFQGTGSPTPGATTCAAAPR